MKFNQELFQNAPPYMIIRLTYIHVQLLAKPHGDYDKSALYSYAFFSQIHINIVAGLNETSDKIHTKRIANP